MPPREPSPCSASPLPPCSDQQAMNTSFTTRKSSSSKELADRLRNLKLMPFDIFDKRMPKASIFRLPENPSTGPSKPFQEGIEILCRKAEHQFIVGRLWGVMKLHQHEHGTTGIGRQVDDLADSA